MAANLFSSEEEYIDIEVGSSANLFGYSMSSPPPAREFEFHMSSTSAGTEPVTFPADELFYKGKLLPLHLPPRLQMFQNLLHATEAFEDQQCCLPVSTNSASSLALESDISPPESRRESIELNSADECFFEWSSTKTGSVNVVHQSKKSNNWSEKLKQVKQSSLGKKLKASRAYLKSLFDYKSGCSDESCAKAATAAEAESFCRGKGSLSEHMSVARKNPFGQTDKNERCTISSTITVAKSMGKEFIEEDVSSSQRRSFSGAIKLHSAVAKCSSSSSSSSGSSASSSFSFNSNGFCDQLQSLRRSSSASSETETSVEGAIAHCKQSQHSRKHVNEVDLCSLSAPRIAGFEDGERI
ncbi:probable membrane-associated kinase regulator 4 [Malania oleifera]|uniref:probable membrane-associated kinase regulator 4 n=1 Tax=Malania oleifera TaxID=397392 RepID=UPI0025AE20D8|nr:probable membrane-associated kinase regulator 4 [Malania oleifera]